MRYLSNRFTFALYFQAAGLCSSNYQNKLPLSVSGTYVKTACFIQLVGNQVDANNYCIGNGMKLFVVNSAAIQTAVFAALLAGFGPNPVVLRADGLRDEAGDNKWYFYANGKTPAFTGLSWLTSNDTLPGLNSLVITNMAYPMQKYNPTFKIDGLDSVTAFNVLCEYV